VRPGVLRARGCQVWHGSEGPGHLTRPPALRSAPEQPLSRATRDRISCEQPRPRWAQADLLHGMTRSGGRDHKPKGAGQPEDRTGRLLQEPRRSTNQQARASDNEQDDATPPGAIPLHRLWHRPPYRSPRPPDPSKTQCAQSLLHALLRRTTCLTPSADRPPIDSLGETRSPTFHDSQARSTRFGFDFACFGQAAATCSGSRTTCSSELQSCDTCDGRSAPTRGGQSHAPGMPQIPRSPGRPPTDRRHSNTSPTWRAHAQNPVPPADRLIR